MKKITLLLFVLISYLAFSQGVYVELGKVDSSFEFKDSNGVELQNLQHSTQNYVEAGYRHNIFTEGLNIGLGLVYNSYGATGSDETQNNFFEWDVDYLGFTFGVDYNLFYFKKLGFHLKATASYEFLVQGSQIINNQVINLIDVEEFENDVIFFRGGAGFTYPVSETVDLYIQYLYGTSLALKDNTDSNSQEELRIMTHMAGVGVRIRFPQQSEEEEEINSETED